MLVLSRRANQQILFPNVGITVNVLKTGGQVVKLGIEAPNDIRVIRNEAVDDPSGLPAPRRETKFDRHAFLNSLNTIQLALQLFQKQSEMGLAEDANRSFERVISLLAELDEQYSDSKESPPPAAAKPTRLLVVEDDTNERELLSSLLRLHGYEVDSVPDGQAALEHLEQAELPDFLLLDMLMPRCDGPTTISTIRHNPRLENLKVLAVSGSNPAALGVEDGPEGVDAWIPKPLDARAVVRAISAATLHASA